MKRYVQEQLKAHWKTRVHRKTVGNSATSCVWVISKGRAEGTFLNKVFFYPNIQHWCFYQTVFSLVHSLILEIFNQNERTIYWKTRVSDENDVPSEKTSSIILKSDGLMTVWGDLLDWELVRQPPHAGTVLLLLNQ